MKASVFFIMYILLSGNMSFLKAQLRDPSTEQHNFFDGSLDILYMNDTKYLMERTPLKSFKGYDQLFPEISYLDEEAFSGNGQIDKKYGIDWIIVNNVLYISDINFKRYSEQEATKFCSNNEKYARLERLTQRKFEKYKCLKGFTYIPNPYGVLEASWITDTIYIKKPYRQNESKEGWNAAPSYRLVFNKGKLMSMSEVPPFDKIRKKEWERHLDIQLKKLLKLRKLKKLKKKVTHEYVYIIRP